MKLDDHPTVKQYRESHPSVVEVQPSAILDAEWLRHLCLEAGADDVGFVEIGRPALSKDRD